MHTVIIISHKTAVRNISITITYLRLSITEN